MLAVPSHRVTFVGQGGHRVRYESGLMIEEVGILRALNHFDHGGVVAVAILREDAKMDCGKRVWELSNEPVRKFLGRKGANEMTRPDKLH